MTRRALAAAALAAALPTILRLLPAPAAAARGCEPEGRGDPPRHWIGCAGDPGPRRALGGAERLAVGLPVDLNRATAEDLAAVPGLSPRLAEQVVADRAEHGPFAAVEDLARVRGVGPARLARARPHVVAVAAEAR